MNNIKSLFRRKSKKELRSDGRTTPSPSPGRPASAAGAYAGRGTSSTAAPPVPSIPANVTPTRTRQAQSVDSTPVQMESSLGGSAARRYDNMPAGVAPERGSQPANGARGQDYVSNEQPQQFQTSVTTNTTTTTYQSQQAKQSQQAPTGYRKSSLSNPSGTGPNAQMPARRSVPPGTAYSSEQTYNEPQLNAQSGAYSQNMSSNGNNMPNYRQSEDIPPVPRYDAPTQDYSKRSTIAGMPSGDRTANHDRMTSTSSTGSGLRTPIADQFVASSWYKQEGSPPIPEFSPIHPGSNNNNNTPMGSSQQRSLNRDDDRYGGMQQDRRVNQAPVRQNFDNSQATQRSAAPGQVMHAPTNNGTYGLEQEQALDRSSRAMQQNGDAIQPRRQSIPRKTLEKPLPVPTPAQGQESRPQERLQDKLPFRERAPVTESINTTTSNGQTEDMGRIATPSSPIRTGQYMRNPVQSTGNREMRSGPQQIYQRSYVVEGASSPPSLQGIVDLNNTVDTTTDVQYAPAVLHETVKPHVHHIREERITREIHNYHVYHRVLPIIDVQVVAPKHIVRVGDGPDATWQEIPEELVPGRQHRNWVIAETVTKSAGPIDRAAQGPRRFTARTFEGTEGDYKEYINAQGVPTTETTWIHPPTINWEGYRRGLTLPLDMD